MDVVAWVLGVLISVALGVGGVMKVLDLDPNRIELRYTKRQWQLIGLAEIAAVGGIIVGLLRESLEWLAITAAVGVSALMLGALIAHARVEHEAKRIIPALVVLTVSAAFIVFISLR